MMLANAFSRVEAEVTREIFAITDRNLVPMIAHRGDFFIFSFVRTIAIHEYVVFPNIVARQSLGLSMSVLSCALRTARKSGNTAIRVHLA